MGWSTILLKDYSWLHVCYLCHSKVLQHIQINVTRDRILLKEKRPNNLILQKAAPNIYLWAAKDVFYEPHIRTLWRFTFPETWKVTSSANITRDKKVSSSAMWSSIVIANASCFGVSSGLISCTIWTLHAFNRSRRWRTLWTVDRFIPSSLAACLIDFCGLLSNDLRTFSIVSSWILGLPPRVLSKHCWSSKTVYTNCL